MHVAPVVAFVGLLVFLAHSFAAIFSRTKIPDILLLILIGLILALLSPLFAQLIKLAISRQREFLADSAGALLTRYPEGLAKALEKISKDPMPLQNVSEATAHLYIKNPLTKGMFASMFSTHPPVEERIKRLRAS